MSNKRNIRIELSDYQFKKYESAAQELLRLGIPVSPQSLIQTLTLNRSEERIVEDFLDLMKNLVYQGKRRIRKKKEFNERKDLSS